jgi:ABC-type transport system involved in multi-copper enzyme maturation permease subunit
MYFWKCWRDNRFLFIACLITFAAMGLFFTLIMVKTGGKDVNPLLWKDIPQLWSRTTEFVLGAYGSMITIIWAVALGSASLGEEFQKGTAEFLLSRPRRRRYWVWVGWSVGVSEMAVAAFVGAGATLATLAWFTGYVFTWRILAAALPLTIGGAAIYSLAYFLAVVARSGRLGLSYSIGIMAISFLLPVAVRNYWHIHVPSIWDFMAQASKFIVTGSGASHAGAYLGWTIVALAFPFATQLLLERAEA